MVLPRLDGFGSIQAHSKSKTVSSKAQIPIVNPFKAQSHVWFMSWMTKHANPPPCQLQEAERRAHTGIWGDLSVGLVACVDGDCSGETGNPGG